MGDERLPPVTLEPDRPWSLLRLVNQGDFSCEYQPFICPTSGEVGGYEALARFWIDGRELLPSAVFADADRDPALFLVLESELKSLQIRNRPDGVPIFVNLHPAMCSQRQLMDHWVELLSPFNDVVVELVESSRVLDLAELHRFVAKLRGAGIPCALDDVGSPDSLFSFELLEACSFLKLDRGWISKLQSDASYRLLLDGILAFCRKKRIVTVLEGVETTEHLELAVGCGIDLVQGFRYAELFQRPTHPNEPKGFEGPVSSLGA